MSTNLNNEHSSANNYIVSQSRNPNLSAPQVDRLRPHEIKLKYQEKWFTGVHPKHCVGFESDTQVLKALPLLNLEICSRQDVLDYFDNTWTLTELLFLSLKNESTYTRPPYHQLRHPMIFYFGHPAVLFINKMRLAGLIKEPVDLYLEKVLETGVDEMSWDDMSKNEMIWPSVETVKEYRQKAYDIIRNVIQTHPDLDYSYRKQNKIYLNQNHELWSLFMGFEHEKIHFETSSVLIRELPIELVEEPPYWPKISKSELLGDPQKIKVQNTFVTVQGQELTYGKTDQVPSYGWDNEYGQRTTKVADFQLTETLITNREFYDFVVSGAYQDDQYWKPEGLHWRKFRNTKRPTFWVAFGPEGLHDYKLRVLFDIIDMPWDWPAEVNYHEAQAYCRWKQTQDQSHLHYRLLTEAEFKTLQLSFDQDPFLQTCHYRDIQNSEQLKSKLNTHYNLNFQFSSATPVKWSSPRAGVYDSIGNIWQWAEDQFNPLEGFKVHKYYDDFSTPCFDGKHQMILGGSFMSCGHEASLYARFHFRPHFYQHAGFRIAATLDGSEDNQSVKLLKTEDYIHPKRFNVLDQMKNENWWQAVNQPLELNSTEIETLYQTTMKSVLKYENQFKTTDPKGSALNVTTDRVGQLNWTYQAQKNFPTQPESFQKLTEFIMTEVADLGQKPGHPGYMAYVAGAANPVSAPAQVLSLVLNQFTGHFNLSPGLVALEAEVIRWFAELFGFNTNTSGGVLTSGGSQANMMALVAARNLKAQLYKEIHKDELALSQMKFYASQNVHHCVGKSLAFLGFPKSSLQIIDVNSAGQMDLQKLEEQIQHDKLAGFMPVAVVATAGSTNVGSIDALNDLHLIAKKHQLWFHVDGAYGALFMLTEKGQTLLKGLSEADSIAFDPHKALQIPYGVGGLIVKNKKHLLFDYEGQSFYMPPSEGAEAKEFFRMDFADFTPELSRDPRGLRVWLPLKVFGIGAFQLNLEEKLKLTEYLYQELQKIKEVDLLPQPELTILAFKLKEQKQTRKLFEAINSTGQVFVSSTYLKGEFYIRVCLLGYRLHFAQVNLLVDLIKTFLV